MTEEKEKWEFFNDYAGYIIEKSGKKIRIKDRNGKICHNLEDDKEK